LLGVTLTVPVLVNVTGPQDDEVFTQLAVPGPDHAQAVGELPPVQLTENVV
jgi:hypothetical protein